MKSHPLRSAAYLAFLACFTTPSECFPQVGPEPSAGIVIDWGQQANNSPGLTNVIAAAAGSLVSLLLTEDGNVYSWDGSQVSPAGITNGTAVAVGANHYLALKSDGTVAAWGDNQNGQAAVPAGLSNVIAIAAGDMFSMALQSNGTVVAWGDNSLRETSVPPGLAGVKAIAAGTLHGLALLTNGTVVTWGWDTSNPPTGTTNVVAIAGGWSHDIALKADGTLVVWGGNDYDSTVVPPDLTNVVAVASGEFQNMALNANGTVAAWGYVPMAPLGLSHVIGIGSGSSALHDMAIYNGSPCLMSWPADQSVYTGMSVLLSVSPVGPSPFGYQWQFNGTNLVGETNGTLTLTNLQLADAGSYSVVVTNPYGSISSPAGIVSTTDSVPIIVVQPTNQMVLAGSNLSLSVTAVGSWPFFYQWQRNGTNLPAATNSDLTLTNIQLGESGESFTATVSNRFGWVASSNATLTALPFLITTQPQSLITSNGALVVWSVVVAGQLPIDYQWQFNGTNLVDATNSTFVLTNALVNQSGEYDVVVSNIWGVAVSSNATLIVMPDALAIVPQNLTTNGGATVTLSSTITGQGPFNYQWQFNGTNLPGATNASLILSNVLDVQSGSYGLSASNAFGAASSSASLTVLPWITVSVSPSTINSGAGTLLIVSFYVGGFTSPLTYQWTHNGGAWGGPNPGGAMEIIDPPLSWAGTYNVTAGDSYTNLTSSDATLTIIPLTITNQPQSRSAWVGGWAQLKVAAIGRTPIGYQWQFNGTNLPGANTNSLVLTNVQTSQFGRYDVVATNAYTNITSSAVTLLLSQVAVWGGAYGESNLTVGLTNIIAISGGVPTVFQPSDCLALKPDGTVISWPSPTSVLVSNIIAIAGAEPAVALRANGTVSAWSFEGATTVPGLTNIAAIAPYIYGYLALKANGAVIGNASVAGLTNAVAIAEGNGHSLALKADGTVAAWGNNSYGQTNVPPGLSNVVAIAAGYYHSLALKADGTMVAWGNNSSGQTNVPASLSNVVAIAAGGYHSLALTSNGTVTAWGMNLYNQKGVPPGLTNVVAIAAGEYHSLALIGNGPPVSQAPLANPGEATNGFSLSLPTQSGRTYVLQYLSSLADSNWTSLPLTPGNGAALLLTDPSATNSQRFYRVLRW